MHDSYEVSLLRVSVVSGEESGTSLLGRIGPTKILARHEHETRCVIG